MRGASLRDRRRHEKLMKLLGLNESLKCMARANGVRWYDHVLRREEEHVLRRALDFRVEGLKKKGRSKKTWMKQVEEENRMDELVKADAQNRPIWRVGVYKLLARGISSHPRLSRKKPDHNWLLLLLSMSSWALFSGNSGLETI